MSERLTDQRVLAIFEDGQERHPERVARALGREWPDVLVNLYLLDLERAGLLVRRWGRRHILYTITPAGRAALAKEGVRP